MEFGEIRNISYPEPQPDDFGGFAGVESGALFFDWEPSQSYTLPDGTVLFEVCFKMLGEPNPMCIAEALPLKKNHECMILEFIESAKNIKINTALKLLSLLRRS